MIQVVAAVHVTVSDIVTLPLHSFILPLLIVRSTVGSRVPLNIAIRFAVVPLYAVNVPQITILPSDLITPALTLLFAPPVVTNTVSSDPSLFKRATRFAVVQL